MLKKDSYLIENIDYKTQITDKGFKIDYKKSENKIIVKAGDEQFYPVP